MVEPPETNQRWQFSIRRMLFATAALAAMLGIFGPIAGYDMRVVWFLSALLVSSILFPRMVRITAGGFVFLACGILAKMIGDLLWPPIGPAPTDTHTGLIGAPLVFWAAACLRRYGGFNAWHLLGALILWVVLCGLLLGTF